MLVEHLGSLIAADLVQVLFYPGSLEFQEDIVYQGCEGCDVEVGIVAIQGNHQVLLDERSLLSGLTAPERTAAGAALHPFCINP